jgi:hypothetical protein
VKRAVLVGLAGLLLSLSYVAASASADTPGYLTASYPEAASYEPFTEPPSPAPEEYLVPRRVSRLVSNARNEGPDCLAEAGVEGLGLV